MPLRHWTEQQRRAYRLPGGRYNSAKLAPHVQCLREHGLTLRKIAELTSIPYSAIKASTAYVAPQPSKGVLLSHLAVELNVTVRAVCQYIEDHGLRTARYGQKVVVASEDAARISEHYRQAISPQEAANTSQWWTMAQLAAAFGISVKAMQLRMRADPYRGIRRVRVQGARGKQMRYSTHDARRVLSTLPIGLTAPPAGTLNTPELARLLGVTRYTLSHYAKEGCPHVHVRRGRSPSLYFRPEAVSAWLLASPNRVRRSLGRTLAARLAELGRAA